MFPIRPRLLCTAVQAAVLGALTPASAAANTLPELEMITVVGKVAQPLSQAPASASVITADQLESSLALDVRDAFRFEPGMSVRRDPNRFGFGTVTVRGLTGNRVLMETDGVPTASTFSVGSFSDAGRQFSDLELVKRIEVLKGPASALYGSDAIAGVIATTTVDPADLLSGDEASAFRARSGYSSDDHSAFAGLSSAIRAGEFDALLAYSRREGSELQNAYRTTDANPRDYDSDAALARFVYHGFGQPLRLTLGWERQRSLTDVDSLELVTTPGSRFANTLFLQGQDLSENRRIVLDQRLQGVGPFDHAEWRLYWLESDVVQLTDEERRAAGARNPPQILARDFYYSEQAFGGELTLSRLLDHAAGPHQLVAGTEFGRSRIRERREGLQTNLLTGAVTNVVLGEVMPVRDFPISEVTDVGLYLQDEWRPGDGRWSVIPALRLDWYQLKPEVDAMYAADNPTQTPVSVDEVSFSPKLALAYRLNEWSSLYLQYAHGFRSQPFEDVNIGLDLPLFNTRAIPNPDLRPERSDSVELGLRLSGRALQGSVSAYLSRYRDFIESRVNLGLDPASGRITFQSLNIGRAEIYGAELAVAARIGEWAPALAGFTARLSAAYARGKDTGRNLPINSIDPLRGVLGLQYEAPSERWSTTLSLTAVQGVKRVDQSRTALFEPGGFATLDLTTGLQLTPRLRINAGLFNLTDKHYYEWADVRGRAPTDPLLELYQQPGRNVTVSITANF